MHELLCNVFLFSAAQVFGKDVETTKSQLESIGKKFDQEELVLGDYHPSIRDTILFYLENRSKLW